MSSDSSFKTCRCAEPLESEDFSRWTDAAAKYKELTEAQGPIIDDSDGGSGDAEVEAELGHGQSPLRGAARAPFGSR